MHRIFYCTKHSHYRGFAFSLAIYDLVCARKGLVQAMYRYIGIEDLVASALIELLRQAETNRKVSLQMLADYGTVIVKILANSGQDAILFLTKESTYEFVHDYADFFSIQEYDGIEYIELRDGIAIPELRRQFRRNLTVDLAKAFTEKESLEVLMVGTEV